MPWSKKDSHNADSLHASFSRSIVNNCIARSIDPLARMVQAML